MTSILDDCARYELEDADPEYVREDVCPHPMWDVEACRSWWSAKAEAQQQRLDEGKDDRDFGD
jgi:hypothetical protein